MKIKPISSNVIHVETADGTVFELYDGIAGLSVWVVDGVLLLKELNLKTRELDKVWQGGSITMSKGVE
ncbi:hypothetical protein LCGC14_0801680 [marine sediment metagenome]|uniref:Uncharacterized protein n=1 Tax=marine sediment metagenome TaxID=412755 RepID=A0A0F9PPB5_9ZZZZ